MEPSTLALLVSIMTLSPVTLLLASRYRTWDRTSLFDCACLRSTHALRVTFSWVSMTPLRSLGKGVQVPEALFSLELSKIRTNDVPFMTCTDPAAPAHV